MTSNSTFNAEGYIKWLMGTAISWYLSIVVTIILSYAIVNQFHPEETNILIGFGAGLCVGLAQWLLLRKSHSVSFFWVLAHAIGIGVPAGFGIAGLEGMFDYTSIIEKETTFSILSFLLSGLLTSIVLLPILKRLTKDYILFVAVYSIAWCLSLQYFMWGGLIIGIVSTLLFHHKLKAEVE